MPARYTTHLGVVLAALCLGAAAHAQPTPPRFERFGIEDGLSSNSVLSLLQDRQGFLWIGTIDGLNRYDGYTFETYRHDPRDPHSLSNHNVNVLLEDRNGRFWAGTDDGLNRLDRRTGRFARYRLAGARHAGPQHVTRLLEDRAGRVWAVVNNVLCRYDAHRDRLVRVPLADPAAPAADLFRDARRAGTEIVPARDGRLWVVHGVHLLRYAPDTGAVEAVRMPAPFTGRRLYEDARGRLWVFQYTGGYHYDPHIRQWSAFDGLLARINIFDTAADSTGQLWLARGESLDGLLRYDPAAGTATSVRTDPDPNAVLANLVWALHIDRAGALWAGSMSGLFRLDPYVQPFVHIGADPRDAGHWIHNPVMAIAADAGRRFWLGTYGAGLLLLDEAAGTVTRYRPAAGDAARCDDKIWAVQRMSSGPVWVGGEGGLCRLEVASGRFTRRLLPSPASRPRVNTLYEDRHGDLWVGAVGGLFRLPRGQGPPDRHLPAAEVGEVVALHEDRRGGLWLSSVRGRLFRLDPATMAYTAFPLGRVIPTEQGFWAFHETADGRFWLGSDQGLTRFDPERGLLRHYTKQDGLPGTIVYALLPDGAGCLWLSTNRGLVRFVPATGAMRVFGADDGLHSIEFSRRAALADGRTLHFGDLTGVTRFDPAALRTNPRPPPVVLTGVHVANRDTARALPPFGLERLDLTYRDYTVAFNFAALNYTAPARNRYAYMLEGFDDDWVDAGTRRFASYTNLPTGRYTFRVKAANNDGVWNEAGLALPVWVAPPYWATWWFRLGVLLLGAGLLTGLYRYRIAQIRRLERLRLRIASDLHDDIGSRLSSIALMSEMVRDRSDLPDFEAAQLTRVGRTAREMVSALRDIIWFIDPEHDATDDLLVHMRETAAALLNGTAFTLDAPSMPSRLPLAFRRHLFLIYKEALHNVARHAGAGQVTVTLRTDGAALAMTVRDDGRGFGPAGDGHGYGLRTMRRRAEQMGGALRVDSTPGGGTVLQLRIPLTYENT